MDYLSDDIQILRDLKASDLLVSILGKTYQRTAKRDLNLVARLMQRDEVHPEVVEKLDNIVAMLPPLEVAESVDENGGESDEEE